MKRSCESISMKVENLAHTAKCSSRPERKRKKLSCVYDKPCQAWNFDTQEDPFKYSKYAFRKKGQYMYPVTHF